MKQAGQVIFRNNYIFFMNNWKKNFLIKILQKIAQKILSRQKPRVIGITGSVGKSITKEVTAMLLEDFFRVGKNEKNFNTEIGVPLAICGSQPPKSLFGWFGIFGKSLKNLFFKNDYPEILVLEMGSDKKGDIKYLCEITKPLIGILTNIGISHLEKFKTVKNLVKEKSDLLFSLPAGGWAVFNYDDLECRKISQKIKAEIVGYGFSEGSTVRATDVFLFYEESTEENVQGEKNFKIPKGTGFKINYQGKILPIRLNGFFGVPAVYSALAAFSVGLYFQLNPLKMVTSLQKNLQLDKRMHFKKGIKKTWLLDDSYNSAPDSLNASLDVLNEVHSSRKIVVLGDMLELGSEEETSHRKIGQRLANERFDFFLAVGERMKWAEEEYQKKQEFAIENSFIRFADSEEAGKFLQEFILPGDIILVKGSRGMAMDRIVEELEFKEHNLDEE